MTAIYYLVFSYYIGFDLWVGKIPWRRKWQLTSELLPGESHEQRSLVGYSPWGSKESDMTEQLHVHLRNTISRMASKEALVIKNPLANA